MCSTELQSGLLRKTAVRCSLVLLLVLMASTWPLQAQNTPEQKARSTQIWLVTYGPGEIYWQSFGHNAIWIRDPELGLDHVFNFGFFDFDQDNFFRRFLQGKMLYFSAAQPAEREFSCCQRRSYKPGRA